MGKRKASKYKQTDVKRRARSRRTPEEVAKDFSGQGIDPSHFEVQEIPPKGRGVRTKREIAKGEYVLTYYGEYISAEEGETREEADSTGYRYFFLYDGKTWCIDASEECEELGRLVNHGTGQEANCTMKKIIDKKPYLCLFANRIIKKGEEILYDYGVQDLPWEKKKQKRGHKNKVNSTNIEELDDRPNSKNTDMIQECQSQISQYSSVMEKKRPEMLSPSLTNSTETQKQKCFVSTGLDVPQLKELHKLAVLNQCQFCTKFDKDVTHVIVKTDPIGSCICDRTFKFFQGISQKCWILDYQWVIDSRIAGHLLPEDQFEIKGDTVTEQLHCGPKRARLNTSAPLFDNIQFLVIGKDKDLQKDDLKSLLVSCGGHVKYESKDIIDKQGSLVITCSCYDDEGPSPDELRLFKEYYDHHGMITVSREWALDCLTVYKLLPVLDYTLTPSKIETENQSDMETKDESSQHMDKDKVMKFCKDDLEVNLLYRDMDGVNLTTTNDQEDSLNTEMETDPEDTSVMETGNDAREINLDIGAKVQSKEGIENIEIDKTDERDEGVMENKDKEKNVKMAESEENRKVEDQNKNKNTSDTGLKTTEVEIIIDTGKESRERETGVKIAVTDEKKESEEKGKKQEIAATTDKGGKDNVKKGTERELDVTASYEIEEKKNETENIETASTEYKNDKNEGDQIKKDVAADDVQILMKPNDVQNKDFDAEDNDTETKMKKENTEGTSNGGLGIKIASVRIGADLNSDKCQSKGVGAVRLLFGPKSTEMVQSKGDIENIEMDKTDERDEGVMENEYTEKNVKMAESEENRKVEDQNKNKNTSDTGLKTTEVEIIIDTGKESRERETGVKIAVTDEKKESEEKGKKQEIAATTDKGGKDNVKKGTERELDVTASYEIEEKKNETENIETASTEYKNDKNEGDQIKKDVAADDVQILMKPNDVQNKDFDAEDNDTETKMKKENTEGTSNGGLGIKIASVRIGADLNSDKDQFKKCSIGLGDEDKVMKVCKDDFEVNLLYRDMDGVNFTTTNDQEDSLNTEMEAEPEDTSVMETGNDAREINLDIGEMVQTVQDSARGLRIPNITPESCDLTCMSTYKDGGSTVVEFLIECSKNGEDWIPVEKVDKYSNTFKVKDIEDGKQYCFRVSAVNKAGQNKTLTSEFVEIEKAPSAPGKPDGSLEVKEIQKDSMTLSYQPKESNGGSSAAVIVADHDYISVCATAQINCSDDDNDDNLSDTYPMLKDKDVQQIQTVNKVKNRVGKHDYSKTHSCIFCGKLDLKISRHLEKKHSNENIIASLPKASKNKQSTEQIKRKQTLDTLRNEGDFLHNVDVYKNIRQGKPSSQQLIVSRRPNEGEHKPEDYLPCKFCLRLYIKSELWRHGKVCSNRGGLNVTLNDEVQQEKRFIKAGKLLLQGAGVSLNRFDDIEKRQDFHHYIVESLADDDIGKQVVNDRSILDFGKSLFERLGRQRSSGIRYSLRLLSRIKSHLLNPVGDGPDLSTFLKPENFDKFVTAVKNIAEVCEEKSLNGVYMLNKPELASKAGQIMKKLSEHHVGAMVAQRNREGREDITDFLFLYETQWTNKVGSQAHQTSKERKFNKKEILPLTQDIITLAKFQNEKIPKLMKALSEHSNIETWKELAFYLLSKIQTFNFRRGNETSRMQLSKYIERADWQKGNQEIYNSLCPMERELAKNMDLVEVMGKQNRKVPVLLTPVMKEGIDMLTCNREKCGISKENIFVFAKGESSYIEGAEALNHVLKDVKGLAHPENIRFPKMRKYFATTVQLFGIQESELAEVARHMGHELAVHRQYYRLQDDVIELAKVSKLLLAVENGKANSFRGMSIDDIDIDGLPIVEDDKDIFESTFAPNHDDTGETDLIHHSLTRDIQAKQVQPSVTTSKSSILPSKVSTAPNHDDTGETDLIHHSLTRDIQAKQVQPSVTTSKSSILPSKVSTVRPKRRLDSKSYKEDFNFADSDEDPDFDIGKAMKKNIQYSIQSDSDSDSEPMVVRKKSKTNTAKKKWTVEEKSALLPLVNKAIKQKKPPKKCDVQILQKRNSCISGLKWLQVKHQIWAVAQQKMKDAKRLLVGE